jgi:hypothetical protein|nr:MAG TPA: hypothetical protein [Caudoviricetes sp.]DAJ52650.1 MAG TPA: hypothetical protein [Caudoviricetes sp.]
MVKDVKETQIIETVLERLKAEDQIILRSHQFVNVLKSVLFGAVKFLANTKFENEAVLRVNDKNGTFIAGIVLERAVDDEGKNSFEARFELNEDGVKDIATTYDLSDEEVQRFLNRFMYVLTNNKFVNNAFVFDITRVILSTIINALMNLNKADIDEDGYEIKFDEYLTASASEEDGERVVVLDPAVDLKKFIKDDKLVDVE